MNLTTVLERFRWLVQSPWYTRRMALWLVVAFIVLSASLILALSLGPLKTAANVRTIRAFAAVQYLAAAVLAGARLTGQA